MFGIKRFIKRSILKYHNSYVSARDLKLSVDRMLSEQGSTLDRMGFVHGTDKACILQQGERVRVAHDYLRHYEFLFQSFRAEKFSLMEFGCQRGNSLRMWEQYFPNAEIYGVDLDESTKQYEKGRVHIVVGDATSQETHDTLKAACESAFIIIDDASHAW